MLSNVTKQRTRPDHQQYQDELYINDLNKKTSLTLLMLPTPRQ